MRIWILNPYVLPPSKEVRFQTIKRAEYLAKQDAIVEVFGDSNIHNSSESLLPFYTYYQKERFLNFTIWFIRSLKYKEDNRLRILSLVSFYFGFWLWSNSAKSIPFETILILKSSILTVCSPEINLSFR